MEANDTTAVRKVYEWAKKNLRDYGCDWQLHNQLCDMFRAALAKPPRNCDVGTAEEQYQRFLKYCKKNTGGCDRADRYANPCAYCFSQWAQMQYESEVNDGK